MPEGDTLFRIAAGLRRALVGETVLEGRARPGPMLRRVPDLSGLAGLQVRGVESKGKHLLIRFGEGEQSRTLRTHLRMSGSWHRYRPGERVAAAGTARDRRPAHRARGGGLFRLSNRRAIDRCWPGALQGTDHARAGPARARLRRRSRAGKPPGSDRRRHRRGAARPAGARRDWERRAERGALHGACQPVGAGARAWAGTELQAVGERRPARSAAPRPGTETARPRGTGDGALGYGSTGEPEGPAADAGPGSKSAVRVSSRA